MSDMEDYYNIRNIRWIFSYKVLKLMTEYEQVRMWRKGEK